MSGFLKKIIKRFCPQITRSNASSPVAAKAGQRYYVLYLGIREVGGPFKEEVTFRNCWDEDDKAREWLKSIVGFIRGWLLAQGVKPETDEEIKIQ